VRKGGYRKLPIKKQNRQHKIKKKNQKLIKNDHKKTQKNKEYSLEYVIKLKKSRFNDLWQVTISVLI